MLWVLGGAGAPHGAACLPGIPDTEKLPGGLGSASSPVESKVVTPGEGHAGFPGPHPPTPPRERQVLCVVSLVQGQAGLQLGERRGSGSGRRQVGRACQGDPTSVGSRVIGSTGFCFSPVLHGDSRIHIFMREAQIFKGVLGKVHSVDP